MKSALLQAFSEPSLNDARETLLLANISVTDAGTYERITS
jgi:hypothetical protein